MINRIIKALLILQVALFFTIAAFNNITDYGSNFEFVKHVLAMDDTFLSPHLMWRSIDSIWLQYFTYGVILLLESTAALMLWFGFFKLIINVSDAKQFNQKLVFANIGLFLGFSLYMLCFLVIGGEWFTMWQSQHWNGQMKAGLFASMIMFVLIFVNLRLSAE